MRFKTLFYLCFFLIPCSVFAQVSKSDSLALVALYEATGGKNWKTNTNWLTNKFVGTWDGVSVEGGKVTALELKANGLKGIIPKDFGQLTGLKRIDLSYNAIGGSIIDLMTKFEQLEYVNFSHTRDSTNQADETYGLRGILSGAFFGLPNLSYVNVSHSRFATIRIISAQNLEYLNAEGNNIQEFKIETQKTPKLKYVNLNKNSIRDLPNMSLAKRLKTLLVNENKLSFGFLEPNIKIDSFTYQNQSKLGKVQQFVVTPSTFLTISLETSGSANNYQWFFNDKAIEGATSKSYSFAGGAVRRQDEGRYHCQVTNNNVPNLTLQSADFNVFITTKSDVLRDSMALTEFFLSTAAKGWRVDRFWVSNKPLGEWTGVTTNAGRRVTKIELIDNKVGGFTPKQMKNLTYLEVFDMRKNNLQVTDVMTQLPKLKSIRLDGNKMKFLPDFSKSKVDTLTVAGNNLLFGDLEPNMKLPYFTYTPQEYFGKRKDTLLVKGDLLTLDMKTTGTANRYQWYKDSVKIEGADKWRLTKQNIQLSDAGDYVCRVTNDKVPNLILQSLPITVRINPVGLEDVYVASPPMIYPNPVDDFLEIRLNKLYTHPLKAQIIDAQGAVLRSFLINALRTRINLTTLQPNMYILKIVKQNGVFHQKLIVH